MRRKKGGGEKKYPYCFVVPKPIREKKRESMKQGQLSGFPIERKLRQEKEGKGGRPPDRFV